MPRKTSFFVLGIFLSLFSLVPVSAYAGDTVTKLGPHSYAIGDLTFDQHTREIRLPIRSNLREGLLEVILCTPQGKTHESLFSTSVSPTQLQVALLVLGFTPWFTPGDHLPHHSYARAIPDSVSRFALEVEFSSGERLPVERLVLDRSHGNKPMPPTAWAFTSSEIEPSGVLTAERDQTLIATYQMPTILLNSGAGRLNDELYIVNTAEIQRREPETLIIKPYTTAK